MARRRRRPAPLHPLRLPPRPHLGAPLTAAAAAAAATALLLQRGQVRPQPGGLELCTPPARLELREPPLQQRPLPQQRRARRAVRTAHAAHAVRTLRARRRP